MKQSPKKCPLCDATPKYSGGDHWYWLVVHLDRHCGNSYYWRCPCGYEIVAMEAYSMGRMAEHLQSQDDLFGHLALGMIARVGGSND